MDVNKVLFFCFNSNCYHNMSTNKLFSTAMWINEKKQTVNTSQSSLDLVLHYVKSY